MELKCNEEQQVAVCWCVDPRKSFESCGLTFPTWWPDPVRHVVMSMTDMLLDPAF